LLKIYGHMDEKYCFMTLRMLDLLYFSYNVVKTGHKDKELV
jgi:hypothetical protein